MECFRYLGFRSCAQVDALGFEEFDMLMEAAQLMQEDMNYRNHLQAYLNFRARDKRKVGKDKQEYVYKTFDQFYPKAKKKKSGGRFDALSRHMKEIGNG